MANTKPKYSIIKGLLKGGKLSIEVALAAGVVWGLNELGAPIPEGFEAELTVVITGFIEMLRNYLKTNNILPAALERFI